MLTHLHISQYALIETLDIDFCQGFNVITGETGAGKSIIMGALALIMGARAEQQAIRRGAAKCIVEATFTVDRRMPELDDFDIDDEMIVRREITQNGKSRAFIADTPVTLQQLRRTVQQLVDIHSQHENLLLNNANFQLNIVDTVAHTEPELKAYSDAYHAYKVAEQLLEETRLKAEQSVKERDYIEFQYRQLADAKLVKGEQSDLEQELKMLEHAEEIKTELTTASSLMDDEEHGIIVSLKECLQAMRHAAKFVDRIKETADFIEERYIDIREFATDIRRVMDETEVDPQRRTIVEERLSTIYSLEQKHSAGSIDELIKVRDQYEQQLAEMESFAEETARLEQECDKALAVVKSTAVILAKKRRSALPGIEQYMIERLSYLGMENARIEISMESTDFTPRGADTVEFRFSANKNSELRAIAEVASGGEIARVMLALKSLIVETLSLETIVFDEIDTGVSGEMANRMGEMMSRISTSAQVLTITHLPQIAARGNAHYKVYKQDDAEATVTHIIRLDNEARVEEIAEMLSGHNPSESAKLAARELINK